MTFTEKDILEIEKEVSNLEKALGISAKIHLLEKNKGLQAKPGFWDKQEEAIRINQEIEVLNKQINSFLEIRKELKEIKELFDLVKADKEDVWLKEFEEKFLHLQNKFQELEFFSLFSGEHDNKGAFLSLHAGTGGVDAQDWTQMLERMYLRFAERQGWHAEILDRNYGNEAGLKTATLRFTGPWVYGYLKSENGVHRLLRNSPFNADGLRQTSFALVEVIPELEGQVDFEIKDEDIRIDVFRSSGPGGQSVNTTDSAVRLTHIPTGISISCQSERSQHQNKENAFKILRNKLYQLALQEKEVEEKKLKGKTVKAEWGRQIRSYFLYGNRLIKDHRSNLETANIDAVLDGDLESFTQAYLRWLEKEKINKE